MYERRDEFTVLVESMILTYHDDVKLNTLNETEKVKFADQLVTKLFKDIKKKTFSSPDMKEISKTKGDFTKYKDYKCIGRALRFLEESADQTSHTELTNRVNTIKETYRLLASNKDVFKNAYQFGNDAVILTYCNVCAGLISATSECVSLNIQMINSKTLGGAIAGTRNFGGKSNHVTGLKEFNSLAKSNKLRMINDVIVVKNEAFIDGAKSALKTAGRLTAGAGIGVAGIIFLLAAVKRLCFTYFYQRIKLADHARNTAEFVQMKSEGITDNNVKAKQQKWIEKLLAFAEKVDVDSKSANAKADEEIKKTDQEISDMPTTWIM